MYIFNKDRDAFYNSKNVKAFWVDVGHVPLNEPFVDRYCIYADDDVLGDYLNYDDAVKELNEIFKMLESGATSYQVE